MRFVEFGRPNGKGDGGTEAVHVDADSVVCVEQNSKDTTRLVTSAGHAVTIVGTVKDTLAKLAKPAAAKEQTTE